MYICSYREIEQELILRQSKSGFCRGLIRISDVSDISEKFCLIHFQDMKLSHIDYPKAIKNKLKEACYGEFSSYLLDPKLTSLRTICEIIVDRELSKADENTFRLFFNVAKEDDLKKGIQKFDIDRLKPAYCGIHCCWHKSRPPENCQPQCAFPRR